MLFIILVDLIAARLQVYDYYRRFSRNLLTQIIIESIYINVIIYILITISRDSYGELYILATSQVIYRCI